MQKARTSAVVGIDKSIGQKLLDSLLHKLSARRIEQCIYTWLRYVMVDCYTFHDMVRGFVEFICEAEPDLILTPKGVSLFKNKPEYIFPYALMLKSEINYCMYLLDNRTHCFVKYRPYFAYCSIKEYRFRLSISTTQRLLFLNTFLYRTLMSISMKYYNMAQSMEYKALLYQIHCLIYQVALSNHKSSCNCNNKQMELNNDIQDELKNSMLQFAEVVAFVLCII